MLKPRGERVTECVAARDKYPRALGLYLNWVAVAVGGWGVAKNADVVTKTGSFCARFKKRSGP